jgi:hypothetical protein
MTTRMLGKRARAAVVEYARVRSVAASGQRLQRLHADIGRYIMLSHQRDAKNTNVAKGCVRIFY